MRILFFGDVVAMSGCRFFRAKLTELKKKYQPDVVIVNGENSADGNGILPQSAEHLLDSGADVITTGNHAFRRREIYPVMEDGILPIIRPINVHSSMPGKGIITLDDPRKPITVINVIGRVFMEQADNPFEAMDSVLKTVDSKVIVVDVHAEATSEKIALANYLDGRVSLVVGTHTHVQTADERILKGGTGYITDLGMCGAVDSVLGVKTELSIQYLKTGMPTRLLTADGDKMICGIVADIDKNTGKCSHISRIAEN